MIPVIQDDPEDLPDGVMLLRIAPESFLYPALRVEQGDSRTGDTELLRREGDSLVVLNPLRFDAGSALTRRVPATGNGQIDAAASESGAALVRGRDYRGQDALGYAAAIDNSPWLLVTRIEIAELDGGLRRHLWLVTTGVLLLLGAVGTALMLWRRDQRLRGYQKQAQLASALQESEERLRLALASASQGLYDLDLQTGVAIVSPEYAMMLGHDPATFRETLESWRARVHPDDRAGTSTALDDYLAGRAHSYHVEFRLATAEGGWKWMLSVGQVVERDAAGQPKRMIGTHTDITQMKWAQEGQARVATQLRSLLTNSPTVVYSMQHVGGQLRPVAISENVERVLGYTPLEVMQPDFWPTHVHPDDRTAALPGPLGPRDEATHVYRFRSSRGEYRWVQDHVSVLRRSATGTPIELVGAWSDITAQYEAERALRASEERLRLAMASAKQGLWDYDIVRGTALNSVPVPNAPGFGSQMAETMADEFVDNVHPDDRERVASALHAYASGRADRYEEEFRLETAGTMSRWVQSVGRIVERKPDGSPTRIVGVMTDITERRAFLDALRFRDRAIESAQNAIAIADLDAVLTFVNHAFAEMFEVDREQTAGQSLLQFAEEPAQVGAIVGELMSTGRPWTGEIRAVSPSGRHFDILLSAALVTDEQGQPTGIVGALLDITDRKRSEQAMAASLAEKESLLKEVHHRVKNNLQVISSLLRLELGRTTDDGIKAVLSEMQNRVVSMALLHETLYRSDNLARADLSSYLVRLVNQLFRSSAPPSGRVVLHTDIEQTFVDLEQAVPCGLLVTELVSNSLKHAFADGRAGEVRVTLHHPDNGPGLVLTVSDTGPGLPADFDERRTQSLGLQLVSDLTRQLRGTLTITRQPGASFALAFTPRATATPVHG